MSITTKINESTEPLLVDIYATWCPPCRKMLPIIHEMETEGFNVTKVNSDDESNFCVEHNITSVPTFLVFNQGAVVKRLTGMQSKEALINALKQQ